MGSYFYRVFHNFKLEINEIFFYSYILFAFLSDQGVLIRITEDGRIVEWGVEVYSNRYNYYAPRLQPFMGRIDYYGPEADSIFRGRVRNIGTCTFTYYNAY